MTIGPDYRGHNLSFVVGCPRSGTTWLQRLLACHPKIRTGQESHIFDKAVGPLLQFWHYGLTSKDRRGVGPAAYFTEDEFFRILRSLLGSLLQPMVGSLQPGEIFLEKTPSHARWISEIVELLPECRIVHILRDPRDVVASVLSASRSWGSAWAPNDPREAIWMWIRHVYEVREASEKLPPWQFLEIRYEDLYNSPKGVLKGCSDFLGLDWSDEEISKAMEANQRDVAIATGGTPIPLNGAAARSSGSSVVIEPQGFIRKAKTGNWRTDLTITEKFWIWRTARKEMADFGYRWPFFLP